MKVISILKKHPVDEFAADLVHLIENNTGNVRRTRLLTVAERCTKKCWPNISRRKRRTISALSAVGSIVRQ